jgi:23S rRNA pseudouridine1911/1915/1917 synthase
MPKINETLPIPDHLAGKRLDVVLAELYPDFSRSRLQQWIQQGQILLDGKQVKPKAKVYAEQSLQLQVEFEAVNDHCEPENIPLDIVYEDDELLVVNKPANFVVHPAAGHLSGTLQNALLYHATELQHVPRAGIIHRIDKDTTGLLVVAKTLASHKTLVDQLQAREIHREYQAIVYGVLTGGGSVDQPIGRNPRDRKKMAIREDGKAAVTHYRVLQRFRAHSHIHVQLETGRTHQIRVHMQSLRHGIVGDPAYGGRSKIPPAASQQLLQALAQFKRQALHAWQLSLTHPQTGEAMQWQAPLPDDMHNLLQILQAESAQNNEPAA